MADKFLGDKTIDINALSETIFLDKVEDIIIQLLWDSHHDPVKYIEEMGSKNLMQLEKQIVLSEIANSSVENLPKDKLVMLLDNIKSKLQKHI
jgi:hypothetical protein